MANPKLESDSKSPSAKELEGSMSLEEAGYHGLQAFIRASRVNVGDLVQGHYVVIDPMTLNYVTAPTQAEAIQRFVKAYPHARGSLHRVGEEFDVK